VSALVTGSAALVASLYFSRVVHPNYLVAAAILLPLGVLASRRAADLAVIPLLLLWLAVSLVERGCFRQVWEQAAAAGLPARLTGLAAGLAPRAGPELTLDPLGLFYSALAAGLGVLYAAAGALGVGPRWRTGGVVAAALLLVVMPTATVMAVGQRTGLKRAQDAWVIQAPADASRLARAESPEHDVSRAPLGREAWSESFRLEPPRFLVADQPVQPPGSSLLSVLLRPLRIDDARLLSLICMLAGMAALYRLAPAGARPLALGIVLAAPLAIGTAFGSQVLPALGLLLPAVLLARRGSPLLAGLLAGAACACSHEIALAVPFALLPVLREPAGVRRGLTGLAVGYAVLTLPVFVLDPAAGLARALAIPPIGPGVGLANVLSWRGGELSAAPAAFVLLHVAVALLWLWVLWRVRQQAAAFPLYWAGWFALLGLVTARTTSPANLSLPLSLLMLGGVLVEDDAP
jgi:hypothetical protein